MHNLLFCAHTLCINYITETFLLLSCSDRSKHQLCFVHGQGKKVNKNLKQRTLSSFITKVGNTGNRTPRALHMLAVFASFTFHVINKLHSNGHAALVTAVAPYTNERLFS